MRASLHCVYFSLSCHGYVGLGFELQYSNRVSGISAGEALFGAFRKAKT